MFDSVNFQDRIAYKLPVSIYGRNGFRVHLPNGYKVSVTWEAGTYSDNHDLALHKGFNEWGKKFLSSKTAEVAVLDPKDNLIETPFSDGDIVMGWQYEEDVLKIIQWAKKLANSNVCAHCGMPNDTANFECNKCGAPLKK